MLKAKVQLHHSGQTAVEDPQHNWYVIPTWSQRFSDCKSSLYVRQVGAGEHCNCGSVGQIDRGVGLALCSVCDDHRNAKSPRAPQVAVRVVVFHHDDTPPRSEQAFDDTDTDGTETDDDYVADHARDSSASQ